MRTVHLCQLPTEVELHSICAAQSLSLEQAARFRSSIEVARIWRFEDKLRGLAFRHGCKIEIMPVKGWMFETIHFEASGPGEDLCRFVGALRRFMEDWNR